VTNIDNQMINIWCNPFICFWNLKKL